MRGGMALGGTVTDVSVGEGGALAAHPVRSQNSSIASCDGFNTACTRSSNSAKAASRAANCFARLRTARKASTAQMWTPHTRGRGVLGAEVGFWGADTRVSRQTIILREHRLQGISDGYIRE